MAYDSKTYGTSPFGQPATSAGAASVATKPKGRTGSPSLGNNEALSDHVGEPDSDLPPTGEPSEENADGSAPVLPATYAPKLKSKASKVSALHLPRGRITGLNLVGEGCGWLLVWGTVGFFRAQVPAPVLLFFDRLFTPWGMASCTLLSALVIGQLLRRYELKLRTLKKLATTAIEYGQSHHQADVQNDIYLLLTEAEKRTQQVSAWITSWLIALTALFIIGAFY